MGNQIPTYNRYAPLSDYEGNEQEYPSYQRSGPQPFLGHRGRRGRGGGTPRGNTRPNNNRGVERITTQTENLYPFQEKKEV